MVLKTTAGPLCCIGAPIDSIEFATTTRGLSPGEIANLRSADSSRPTSTGAMCFAISAAATARPLRPLAPRIQTSLLAVLGMPEC